MKPHKHAELKIGDMVTIKNNTYGCFQVKALYPNGYKDKKCYMVEVVHYSGHEPSEFGLVKHFKKVDIKKVQSA